MYSSNFFMKILNLFSIIDKKHSLYVFYFIWNFQILKLLAFLSHRDYEQNSYFWKTPVWQVCGKKYYLKCLLGLKDILHYFFRPHTGGALIYDVRYDTRASHHWQKNNLAHYFFHQLRKIIMFDKRDNRFTLIKSVFHQGKNSAHFFFIISTDKT